MIETYTSWPEFSNQVLAHWLRFNTAIEAPKNTSFTHQTKMRQEVHDIFSVFETTVFILKVNEQIQATATLLIPRKNTPQKTAVLTNEAMICFFNAISEDSTRLLFKQIVQYAQEKKCSRIIGPIQGDTWHPYRFNNGPWEQESFFMEPVQPHSYPTWWIACGFTPLSTYHSLIVNDMDAANKRMERSLRWSKARQIQIEDIQGQSLHTVLKRIYDLTLNSFHQNFLYTPIEYAAFEKLYDGIAPLLEPRMVLFAIDQHGKDIGYLFATPDYDPKHVEQAKSGSLIGKLRLLYRKKRPTGVNIKTVGVIPMPRRAAVAMALMSYLYSYASSLNHCNTARLCLMKDDNASRGLDGGQGKLLRRYTLYQMRLDHER